MLYSCFAFFSLLTQFASTRFITIQNSGFELDLPDYAYGTNSYDYGPIQNWDHYDPHNIMLFWTDGIENPTGGTLYNDPLFGDNAPEGTLISFLEPLRSMALGEFGLFQTLTGNVVTENTTYILSVWVGNPTTNTYSANSIDGSYTYVDGGSRPYMVQLVSDDMVLVQDDNTLSIPEGQWKQSIVTVDILNGNPHIGKTLSIRLIYKDANASNPLTINFDDVRLEALQTIAISSLTPTTSSTNANSVLSTTITGLQRSSVSQTNAPINIVPSTALPSFISSITITATQRLIQTLETKESTDYEWTKPSELTEVMVSLKKHVDMLVVSITTGSIAVCLVIIGVVVCFIKKHNQRIKCKEAVNAIRPRSRSDIDLGSSVSEGNNQNINGETDLPALPGSLETPGYNANIVAKMLDGMGNGESNGVCAPSKQLAQAVFDAMQHELQDEMALGVPLTDEGNVVHNKERMEMIDVSNEENDKDKDSDSDSDIEELWDPGKPVITDNTNNAEIS